MVEDQGVHIAVEVGIDDESVQSPQVGGTRTVELRKIVLVVGLICRKNDKGGIKVIREDRNRRIKKQ